MTCISAHAGAAGDTTEVKMRILKCEERCCKCQRKITTAYRVTFGKYYCSKRCYEIELQG